MNTLAEIEKFYILDTLKKCNGNKSQAAKILDISYRGLQIKLKSYKFKPEENPQEIQKIKNKYYKEIKCSYCNIPFKIDAYYHQKRLRFGQIRFYHNRNCRNAFQIAEKKRTLEIKFVYIKCAFCKTKFFKDMDDYNYKTKKGQTEWHCTKRCSSRAVRKKVRDKLQKKIDNPAASPFVKDPLRCKRCNKLIEKEILTCSDLCAGILKQMSKRKQLGLDDK